MKLSVIGCGYLGAVHAAAMASIGHDVVGIDVDSAKIEMLSRGDAPFFEPGLPEILAEGIASGRLRFSTEIADAKGARVHFIGVGTPQIKDGYAADLTYVHAAFDSLTPYLSKGDIVAGKSTVPVGTAASLASKVEAAGATLVWNPEFLREGFAVKDTIDPDRLVIGLPSTAGFESASTSSAGDEFKQQVTDILREVYHVSVAKGTPFVVTDYATAELVKVAANSFLATKISFINAMAEIAEATGANVTQLADAIGYDERIGRKFLGAGIGFGGGCLPKDIRAFRARAQELGCDDSVVFLKEIDEINLRRRKHAVQIAVAAFDGEISNKRVTVLGAAFKPHSDDIRDSPAIYVASRLHELGALVTVTDPVAIENARRVCPELRYIEDRDEAICGAELLILVTEWDQYRRELTPEHALSLVNTPQIIDGRNALNPADWRAVGWRYFGMGRP